MVAPLVAAAGISAAGSLLGGITGGKGAKKAAKIQAQTSQQQIAALEANRNYIYGLEAPTIDRGNAAGDVYSGLLGVGGDPAKSAQALDTFRGSTGYQDILNTGLKAVNSNAYARGMGDSGATLKALQTRGSSIADQSAQGYLGNLNVLMNQGRQASGNVAGVATNTTAGINQANQTAADASGNAALISAAAWQKALQGVTNAGGSALGSSYGGGGAGGGYGGLIPPPRSSPGYGGGYIGW